MFSPIWGKKRGYITISITNGNWDKNSFHIICFVDDKKHLHGAVLDL